MNEPVDQERHRFHITLPVEIIGKLKVIQKQWGVRSRSDLFESLLEMVSVGDQDTSERCLISFSLPNGMIEKLNLLQNEWGIRSRGDLIERLLEMLLEGDPVASEADTAHSPFEKLGGPSMTKIQDPEDLLERTDGDLAE